MLEELLALGRTGAEYDARLIKIMDGDRFGSGFVAVNPNSKIPALMDYSGSGAILIHLAEKFGHGGSSDLPWMNFRSQVVTAEI